MEADHYYQGSGTGVERSSVLLIAAQKAKLWLTASTRALVNPLLASLLESEEEPPSNLASSGHTFCLNLSRVSIFPKGDVSKIRVPRCSTSEDRRVQMGIGFIGVLINSPMTRAEGSMSWIMDQ